MIRLVGNSDMNCLPICEIFIPRNERAAIFVLETNSTALVQAVEILDGCNDGVGSIVWPNIHTHRQPSSLLVPVLYGLCGREDVFECDVLRGRACCIWARGQWVSRSSRSDWRNLRILPCCCVLILVVVRLDRRLKTSGVGGWLVVGQQLRNIHDFGQYPNSLCRMYIYVLCLLKKSVISQGLGWLSSISRLSQREWTVNDGR